MRHLLYSLLQSTSHRSNVFYLNHTSDWHQIVFWDRKQLSRIETGASVMIQDDTWGNILTLVDLETIRVG